MTWHCRTQTDAVDSFFCLSIFANQESIVGIDGYTALALQVFCPLRKVWALCSWQNKVVLLSMFDQGHGITWLDLESAQTEPLNLCLELKIAENLATFFT